jgi:hypothetical protein
VLFTTQFEAAADAMRRALDCYVELGGSAHYVGW